MAATTLTHPESRTDQVLAAARDNHRAATDLEVERILLAVEWAELHPGEDSEVEWAMRPLLLAGEGAPTVDESAVAEFALAVGMKHETGTRFIGDALELLHRLPRTWPRVAAGEVPVWKARRIAQGTTTLPMDAAAAVDQRLAIVAKRCSFAEIDRQIDRARAEFDPAETERRRVLAAEQRHVTFHFRHVSTDGLVEFSGVADLADAVAFDQLLTAKTKELDPALPLDVRRSMALGYLGDSESGREVVIYTHARPDASIVEVENTRSVITPDQVKEWCAQTGTKVTVRPVIDLADHLSSTGHDPSPTLREQVILRYRCCIFPDCERLARSCDQDHRIPWPIGPTTWWNLFPLCRTHHRLKTTGGWTYRPLDEHTIEWTSPAGFTYLRHID